MVTILRRNTLFKHPEAKPYSQNNLKITTLT
jgi:hypothetical protein